MSHFKQSLFMQDHDLIVKQMHRPHVQYQFVGKRCLTGTRLYEDLPENFV